MTLKDKIINESLRLFSKRGYTATSISDVIQAAGTSKGGFYNHFKSKEQLLAEVLRSARKTWRMKNLAGLDREGGPLARLRKLLENFSGPYLRDGENPGGGCPFIFLALEFGQQPPQAGREISNRFIGLKGMIGSFLEQAYSEEEIRPEISVSDETEIIFNSVLGAALSYSMDHSESALEKSFDAVFKHLEMLRG